MSRRIGGWIRGRTIGDAAHHYCVYADPAIRFAVGLVVLEGIVVIEGDGDISAVEVPGSEIYPFSSIEILMNLR
ncbi:hypothetical protein [Candidatus Poriferisocius sp.]|uniref:hypothetical protein n=1 Tax=Candidatus Poriferisocius sp. TaxID=3101276 RepID=UPI003B02A632